MKFIRIHINREEKFSLGIEETPGRFYVSLPVSSGFADDEKYYAIDAHLFEWFRNDLDSAVQFVNRCRRHEFDELLMEKPGGNRGSAI